MSFSGLRASSVRLVLLFLSLVICRSAAAQIVEPNGISVPATVSNGETTLQQFFTSKGEGLNAVTNAAISPAVFLPLCDFQATLVLSQSGAQAGLDWYNVPTSPTAKPTIYAIGTPPLAVGSTVGSSDIRNDPNYQGGLIGFALMKNLGNGYVPVYYSEYMRNADCTGCTMPGYWKMALSYQSTTMPNSYYMAWEDWEGADQNTWQQNDGDFNDKVFQVTGVTCNGGGVPCDTGMKGVCSLGVTQCQSGGTIICKPTVTASSEKCDNLDNDCDGTIDNGSGLCPNNWICVQGTCTNPCDGGEFACQLGWQCQNGLCVDPRCVGKNCQVGQICQAGTCVGGCDGVTCPLGQQCQLGVCVDPCAGVTCNGSVCDRGACVTVCSCQPCGTGKVCTNDGHCVDTGCDSMTCSTGQVCRAGACTDACQGAVCPGGADCHNGVCDPPMIGQTTTPTGGTSGSGAAGAAGTGNSGGTTGQGGGAGGATTGAGGGGRGGAVGGTTSGAGGSTTGPHAAGGELGCSCTAAGGSSAGLSTLLALVVGGALRRRRRAPRAGKRYSPPGASSS